MAGRGRNLKYMHHLVCTFTRCLLCILSEKWKTLKGSYGVLTGDQHQTKPLGDRDDMRKKKSCRSMYKNEITIQTIKKNLPLLANMNDCCFSISYSFCLTSR